ncbi:NADPH-dependent FMN reductase [Enemella evansiae]|uniref:NADPH-dependent FMN reductase n=1 Tax=Enemella evansiae TaxID=2016499 RepID=UPI000B965ED7|nr:NADPH-dependent FMN reductase [Enemella evansiae]OYO05829.1 FMN reductase (NADPH) [Enemella evansiae]
MARIVTISSSPSVASRTDILLAHVQAIIEAAGHTVVPVVVRDLPARPLVLAEAGDPEIAAAVAAIADADAVVVTSPVYKAAYSGLLKAFLDLLPQTALVGKQVLPLVTGGSPAHVLVVDYALRPVLESLGADHISSGRFVLARAIVKAEQEQRGHLEEGAAAEVDAVTGAFLDRLHAQLAWRSRGERAGGEVVPRPEVAPRRTPSVVFVGGGPRTLGVLERMGASLGDDAQLQVHIVDPHRPGTGRIWRGDQSRLLWMNSHAADITVFTDESVDCAGPVRSGPSLGEWITGAGRPVLVDQGWLAPDDEPDPQAFLPRAVLGEYLGWAWDRIRGQLPPGVEVILHADRAVDVIDQAGRQVVVLAGGERLLADATVLAQGHLDQLLTDDQRELVDKARQQDLTYIPPGYTADLDLSALQPGEPVIVRGMGLAFIDLAVLLAGGRGGSFVEENGELTYRPSGLEPILYAGSRRGVPYHAKLGYAIADGPAPLRHLSLDRLGESGQLDFDSQVWPLIETELADAHYRRLFTAHPERTRGGWADLEQALKSHRATDSRVTALVDELVPDPRDRFDLAAIDRPLTTDRVPAAGAESAVVAHITDDLARRRDRAYSPDRAVFDAFVSIHGFLSGLLAEGRLAVGDRITRVEDGWRGLFSFVCSGPPPRRLAELLALHRAGVVHFLGPELSVELDGDHFVARSQGHETGVRTRALVDAFLARVDINETADPAIRSLLARGQLATERIPGPDGGRLPGGLLRTDREARALRRDGSVHPNRYLVGPSVSGSAGAGGLARPGFNAPAFRQNDRLARTLLGGLGLGTVPDRRTTSITPEAAA